MLPPLVANVAQHDSHTLTLRTSHAVGAGKNPLRSPLIDLPPSILVRLILAFEAISTSSGAGLLNRARVALAAFVGARTQGAAVVSIAGGLVGVVLLINDDGRFGGCDVTGTASVGIKLGGLIENTVSVPHSTIEPSTL